MTRRLILLMTVGLICASCRPNQHEPTYDAAAPDMASALSMAKGAELYFLQHGQFPDSLAEFQHYIKPPAPAKTCQFDGNTMMLVYERDEGQAVDYKPVIQYPGTTVAGENNRTVLGFEVVPIPQSVFDWHTVDGRYDSQGRMVIVVR